MLRTSIAFALVLALSTSAGAQGSCIIQAHANYCSQAPVGQLPHWDCGMSEGEIPMCPKDDFEDCLAAAQDAWTQCVEWVWDYACGQQQIIEGNLVEGQQYCITQYPPNTAERRQCFNQLACDIEQAFDDLDEWVEQSLEQCADQFYAAAANCCEPCEEQMDSGSTVETKRVPDVIESGALYPRLADPIKWRRIGLIQSRAAMKATAGSQMPFVFSRWR